jgi:helix-turn-helix protein
MADMSDMFKNFSSMMDGKEIPDNIKEMLNSLANNSSNFSNSSNSENTKADIRTDFTNNSGIDIETMMKMQKIMSAMNSSSNNSGANLLRSLKPYLNPSRQKKVDEYIQLFNIEKVINLMNQSGGDKKDGS